MSFFRKNIFVLSFILILSSCGSKKKDAFVDGSNQDKNRSISLLKEGSGKHSANSIPEFRQLLSQGSFVAQKYYFFDHRDYILTSEHCLIEKSDFLFWDDAVSKINCYNDGPYIKVTEYKDGRIDDHPFGNNKTEILASLLEIFDQANHRELMYNNNYIPNASSQASILKVIIQNNTHEKIYYINLKLPLVENPVNSYVKDNPSSSYNTKRIIPYNVNY